MKDRLIKDIELKLALNGYDRDEIDKITHCVISCLDEYEVSEATTEITVRHEDVNEQILKRYMACLQIDGKAKGTIKRYLQTLVRLSASARKPYTEMGANDIRFYLVNLKANECKNSYIKSQRAYISAFFKWMHAEEYISKNPVNKVNAIKCEQEVLLPFSPVEIDKIRTAIDGHFALRNRAIVETFLSSGIRCAELCALRVDDLDLKERTLMIRKGKGGKGRIVYVSEVAAEHIGKYLKARKSDTQILFASRKGNKMMSDNGIGLMLNTISDASGVNNIHAHRFRRTFATTMYKRGMDLEEIRKLMGHTNVQTTLRYIYTDETQLKAAYDKYAA